MYSVEQTFIEDQCARHWVGHQNHSNEGIPHLQEFVFSLWCSLSSQSAFKNRAQTSIWKAGEIPKIGSHPTIYSSIINLPTYLPTHSPTYPPTCISCILVICLHIVCKGVILELKSQKIVMIYRIYRVKYTVLLRCCYYHSRRIPSELDVATLAGLLLLSYAAGKTANFLCKINMFCGCVVCFTWWKIYLSVSDSVSKEINLVTLHLNFLIFGAGCGSVVYVPSVSETKQDCTFLRTLDYQ